VEEEVLAASAAAVAVVVEPAVVGKILIKEGIGGSRSLLLSRTL